MSMVTRVLSVMATARRSSLVPEAPASSARRIDDGARYAEFVATRAEGDAELTARAEALLRKWRTIAAALRPGEERDQARRNVAEIERVAGRHKWITGGG